MAAVVVTFGCGPEILGNLDAVGREADIVVVVDNGSGPDTLDRLRPWAAAAPGTRRLIENGRNLGLAAAQNRGVAAALEEGAEWIWLFDDDSRPEPGTLAALARMEEAAPGRYDLLAPRILHAEFGTIAPLTVRKGRFGIARPVPEAEDLVEEPVFVIASGSLIRSSGLRTVGGLRDAFFIDYVDVDLCLRLTAAGRRSAVVGAATLHHHLGRPTEHSLPGGARIVATNHSAARLFFMTRNRMRLWREWAVREPGWTVFDAAAFGYQLFRVVAFECDRAAKLAAMARGAFHGLFLRPESWSKPAVPGLRED